MIKQKTWPYFLIALFFTLTSIFPVLAFSPYLAILYRRKGLIHALWMSTLCGLILDLLSTAPFGLYAMEMALLSACMFRFRIYFVDKPIGLSSYTALISLVFTIFSRFALMIYDPILPFTFQGFVTDFLLLPLGDAFYAFLFFSCPLLLYRWFKSKFQKLYFRFLFFKKESNKKEEELSKT